MVREFIEELRKEGRTIFLTTHNLDEADRLCDRIGVFKSHMLVVDSPENLRMQLFGRKVVIHLRQVDSGMEKLVGMLPFVREAHIIEDKLLVNLDNPERDNPDIIRALVTAGADIQFVGELRRSLEDVYLELIKKA
jgi:ABC-2 type transport system ATP-binding protein